MRFALLYLPAALLCSACCATTFTGATSDADGRSLADATVWLYRVTSPGYITSLVASTRTGDDGTFALTDSVEPGPTVHWELYAWKSGLPVAHDGLRDATRPAVLKFPSPAFLQAFFVRPDATPIPGVRIVPVMFGELQNMGSLYIPPGATEVRNAAAVTADAAGQFSLPMSSKTVEAALAVSAPSYGSVELTLDTTISSIRITLQPVGGVRGQVVSPAGPEGALALRLELQGRSRAKQRLTATAAATTDEQGNFSVPDLQPGRWYLTAVNQESRLHHLRLCPVEVRTGETTVVSLKTEPTVLVRGRLVDAVSGQPGVGIGLTINQRGYKVAAKTDAEGKFEVRCLPGEGQLEGAGWSPALASPLRQQQVAIGNTDVQLPDIKVQLIRELQVQVVDEGGAAPKWARVRAQQQGTGSDEASCDGEGWCVLKRLSGGEATIRAIAGDLASDPVTISIDDQHEPLKLVVKPGLLAATKVRVVYEDGTPYGDDITFDARSKSGGGLSSRFRTNAAGVYENHGVEAGLSCCYTVRAPGCPTVQTNEWISGAGEAHDFGTLVLKREPGLVAGTVLDEAGRPVAEALVFNGTDGVRPVSVRTDATGAFSLIGLRPGKAYVLVKAKGYWVEGRLIPVGTTDASFTLRRADRVAIGEPRPLPQVPVPAEVARSLARELLRHTLNQPDAAVGGQSERLLVLLSRIDAAEALKLAGGAGLYQRRVQVTAATSRLSEDFDSGLAMLQALGDPATTVSAILDLAEAVAPAKPDLSGRCLLAAHEALPQVQNARRRVVLAARLGADMLPLDAAIGKSLLQAATDESRQFVGRGPVAERAIVASYLSQVDPAAAVALIGDSPGDEVSKIILGRYLARANPDQALALAAKLQYPAMAHRTMVLYFPPERFEQARDLVLRQGGWDANWILIRLCLNAPRECLPAWIEEVRDILEPEPPGEGIRSIGDREAYDMALLALMARRLSYPEAREVMLRAALNHMASFLWYEPLAGSVRTPRILESHLNLARLVALMEPQLGKRLLPTDLSPQDPEYEAFLGVLAAMDPTRAAELLRAMPTDSQLQKAAYQRATVAVAEALLLPPEEREAALLREARCLPPPNEINSMSWQ